MRDTIRGSLILTNRLESESLNTYIESYSLENRSAEVWMSNGYRKTAQYYEEGSDPRYVSTFSEPLSTPGADDMVMLRGKPGSNDHELTRKYRWLGKQHPVSDGGCVHDNYLYAGMLNSQNMAEIEKTSLRVNLAGMNFYVTRWARVPVLIYTSGDNPKINSILLKRDAELGEDREGDPNRTEPLNELNGEVRKADGLNPGDRVKNEFLSGYYVVHSVDYRYVHPGPMKQSLVLVRREWPIPGRNKDA